MHKKKKYQKAITNEFQSIPKDKFYIVFVHKL